MVFCFLFDSIIDKFKTSKVKLFNIIPKTVIMPENQSSSNAEKNLSVLITGGSGLIGKRLTALLLREGYKVSHLSRNRRSGGDVRVFMWNPEKSMIDFEALDGIDFIIHLAGANIGEKRWTAKRKHEILESRTESSRFLYKTVMERGLHLSGFISASATGIYGAETLTRIFKEEDISGGDFLASVCKKWEEAADLFSNSGIRTVKIRSALVLDKDDSALSGLMKPGKFGFLVRLGGGKQYMPWIHIDDLCNIYLKGIQDQGMKGAYNAAAPDYITHGQFIRVLAKIMKRPLLLPVPGFIIRMILGEMSAVILKGSRVSSEKIINAGYRFHFSKAEDALENVIQG
jgi:uncharacterized protein